MQGAPVRFLVEELRFPHAARHDKKRKKKLSCLLEKSKQRKIRVLLRVVRVQGRNIVR